MKIRKKSAKIENFKIKSSRPKIVFLALGTLKNGLELENQNFMFASGGSLNEIFPGNPLKIQRPKNLEAY